MQRIIYCLGIFALVLTQEGFGADCASSWDEDRESSWTDRPADADARALAQKVLAGKGELEAYVDTLHDALIEREWVVDLGLAALIAQEHLLLLGPPGNAKSMISNLMLGNIVDGNGAPSYFSIQMTPETTMSETHGPFDFKKLTDHNVYERLTKEGMLHAKFAFIDEIFDARPNALRNLLQLLNERTYSQGARQEKGALSTAFAASNHYLTQVYEEQGERPRAVLDRFALIAFVPGEMERGDSYVNLIQSVRQGGRAAINPLKMDYLEDLQALKSHVLIPEVVARQLAVLSSRLKTEAETTEQAQVKKWREDKRNGEDPAPPYRRTKYHSPRTLYKAASLLQAFVLLDWIKSNGQRELVANAEDVAQLQKFFSLNGPSSEFTQAMSERAPNEYELVQHLTILEEARMFEENFAQTRKEMSEAVAKYGLAELEAQVEGVLSEAAKAEIKGKLLDILEQVAKEPQQLMAHAETNGEVAGQVLVRDYVFELLKEISDGQTVEEVRAEIARTEEELRRKIETEAEEERRRKDETERERQKILEEHRRIVERNQRIADILGEKHKWNTQSFNLNMNANTSTFDVMRGLAELLAYDQSTGRVVRLNLVTGDRAHAQMPAEIQRSLTQEAIGRIQQLIPVGENQMVLVAEHSILAMNLDGKITRRFPFQVGSGDQVSEAGDGEQILVANPMDTNISLFNYQTGASEMINLRTDLSGLTELPVQPTFDYFVHYLVHNGELFVYNGDLTHAFAIDLHAKSIRYVGPVSGQPVANVSQTFSIRYDGKVEFKAVGSSRTAVTYEVVLGEMPITRMVTQAADRHLDREVYGERYAGVLLAGSNVMIAAGQNETGFYNLEVDPGEGAYIPFHPIAATPGAEHPFVMQLSEDRLLVVFDNGANIHLLTIPQDR